uniref:RNase H type-1 domain-containing protein n=1 Tax=Pelodiscus sinensis TaxID=13735 RepID=K7F6G4_PELSI
MTVNPTTALQVSLLSPSHAPTFLMSLSLTPTLCYSLTVPALVVSLSETLEAAPLPSVTSAQVAELVALTRTCFLAEGRSASIYTDSRYAFGVVHDFGTLWQARGFLTSAGTPIKNGPYIAALLYAVLLPSALAIVKCPGHSTADTDVAKGNAAIEPSPGAFLGSLSVSVPPPSLSDLTLLQDSAPEAEKDSWVAQGCSLHPDSL